MIGGCPISPQCVNGQEETAMGEEGVNFTKIGIINNLRYSSSCYSGRLSKEGLKEIRSEDQENRWYKIPSLMDVRKHIFLMPRR